MSEKQKNGDIIYHLDFSTVKLGTISKAWTRMKKCLKLIKLKIRHVF